IAIWTFGKTEPDAVFEGHTAPIAALAASPDGATLASASWDHTVRLWPLAGGAPRVLDEHTQNVNGVAFTADGRALVSVSYDLSVRIWPLSGTQTPTVVAMPTPRNAVATGEPIDPILLEAAGDPLAAYAGDHGAEIFRACVACHTLGADQANRAGPTLAGLFGRRIATAPGYNFSEALKRLDIVWTPETVSKLFEIGPQAYTPGTKMPEQRIGSE